MVCVRLGVCMLVHACVLECIDVGVLLGEFVYVFQYRDVSLGACVFVCACVGVISVWGEGRVGLGRE